jgi:ABC-type phosphate/phosphonate transport system substrate-binding protein
MRKWVGAAVVTLLLLVPGTQSWSQGQLQPLSFGVIIWRSPTLTAQFWNPILRYVSDKSGVPVQLKVAQTGPEHTAMVRRGELHFLYSNHNFIKENEESGYRVFARSKEDVGTGEIVVLKNSSIRTLAELEGQEVVFPHTAAFYGYHPPMDALLRKGIQVKVHKYLSLALSPLPSVPADMVKAVREALLKMADDPEGARVLAASADVLKQAQPLRLVASKDSEFDNMRKFYRTTLVKVELQ